MDVPEVLLDDVARMEAREPGARGRGVFAVLSVVGLLALGLQYAWFMPLDMLQRYPQAAPWLERMCRYAGCKLPERRDAASVQVVSRDVRVHPKYEGALQITAALVNNADFPQPYPRVRFSLFNVNGQTIATRTFMPQEYLGAGVDESAGMTPASSSSRSR